MSPSLHPDLEPLAFLLGTWEGEGRGEYPTIEPFTYSERITFGHVGKPFIAYQQRTMSPEGLPLHAEVGYFRSPGNGIVELVIAQPTGMAEVHAGTVAGTTLDLSATDIIRTPTAKSVTAVIRRISVDGGTLSYRLDMAAVDQSLQYHLEATLHRVPPQD